MGITEAFWTDSGTTQKFKFLWSIFLTLCFTIYAMLNRSTFANLEYSATLIKFSSILIMYMFVKLQRNKSEILSGSGKVIGIIGFYISCALLWMLPILIASVVYTSVLSPDTFDIMRNETMRMGYNAFTAGLIVMTVFILATIISIKIHVKPLLRGIYDDIKRKLKCLFFCDKHVLMVKDVYSFMFIEGIMVVMSVTVLSLYFSTVVEITKNIKSWIMYLAI
jgi:hypothetical protein